MLIEDIAKARETLQRHAKAWQITLEVARSSRLQPAVLARRATFCELRAEPNSWTMSRIARAMGVRHTTVRAALLAVGCPVCGKTPTGMSEKKIPYVAGVATSRAYHHGASRCVTQTAWTLRGEERPV